MDTLTQIQFPLAVIYGIASLACFLWFLRKHRIRLAASFVIRHLAFILCLYLGVLWFLYEEQIITFVFGHVVYKHSPEEMPAVLVILGGVVFWLVVAVVLLGRNRRAEFARYAEAFPFLGRFRR
ncbi:MAG: hypothetical protein QOJ40_1841 [Verrucomicrobiota bacterium]